MGDWYPKTGEEVQAALECGYVEIAKFIQDNDNGTCDVKVGKKRVTLPCRSVSKNIVPYKRNKVKKPVLVSNRNEDDFDKEY